MHGPRHKPGDNVWLDNSVIPNELIPKFSSPWKDPYKILQCLIDVTYKIKNTANQKETILHYDRLKPFLQRPEELQLPRREPKLPRLPETKSAQKPLFASHQYCNCSQILPDQVPLSPRPRSASPAHFLQFLSPKLPSKDLLLQVQNEHPRFLSEPLFVIHLIICLKFHRKHNLQL